MHRESRSGYGSLFNVPEWRGSGFHGSDGDIGLGGPIDGLSVLIDRLADFFVFYFINQDGHPKCHEKDPIYHDLWSEAFSLSASVNTKYPSRLKLS
jgi:hypothetical protein